MYLKHSGMKYQFYHLSIKFWSNLYVSISIEIVGLVMKIAFESHFNLIIFSCMALSSDYTKCLWPFDLIDIFSCSFHLNRNHVIYIDVMWHFFIMTCNEMKYMSTIFLWFKISRSSVFIIHISSNNRNTICDMSISQFIKPITCLFEYAEIIFVEIYQQIFNVEMHHCNYHVTVSFDSPSIAQICLSTMVIRWFLFLLNE